MDTGLLCLVAMFTLPFGLHFAMRAALSGVRSAWKSYLLWEAQPVLIFLVNFIFLAAINWEYESKMMFPRQAPTIAAANIGLIMLIISAALGLAASGLIFVERLIRRALEHSRWRTLGQIATVLLCLIIATAVAAMISIEWLGPAAITMLEQMESVPRQNT